MQRLARPPPPRQVAPAKTRHSNAITPTQTKQPGRQHLLRSWVSWHTQTPSCIFHCTSTALLTIHINTSKQPLGFWRLCQPCLLRAVGHWNSAETVRLYATTASCPAGCEHVVPIGCAKDQFKGLATATNACLLSWTRVLTYYPTAPGNPRHAALMTQLHPTSR